MFYGTYAYFTKLPDKTFLSKKIKMLMLTQSELDAIKNAKNKAVEEAFFNDDDFFD
ncbi:hypothetical protein MNB_SV-13-1129 [hydrothermal vent metagenome]|uniref:Uncharacterized protein n=1 Tax=hydrothermal vent metagenome TaxID=652676 RepID=A0A1W1CL21_9ZZZZ